jgi:hypothetical protein
MQKHSGQREILKCRELRPIDVATLYGPFLGRRRRDELFQKINEVSAANVRQLSAFGIACAEVGPPAAQPGDSDTVKHKVRTALERMRRQYPILDPFVTTVSVTILYVRCLKTQAIDLDHLAIANRGAARASCESCPASALSLYPAIDSGVHRVYSADPARTATSVDGCSRIFSRRASTG